MYQKARAPSLSCNQQVLIFVSLFNVNHTSSELDELAKYIGSLEGETRVVLECTGVTMNQW